MARSISLRLLLAVAAFNIVLAIVACSRHSVGTEGPFVPVPPFVANKLAILAKLKQKDFTGLELEFEQYHQAYQKNPIAELNEKVAYDSFATDDPVIGDLVGEWVNERPNSYAAHLAMGSYFSWRGWYSRGPSVASQTAETRFDAMRRFFSQSEDDIKTAIKLKPDLSIGYALLIGEARAAHRERLKTLEVEAFRAVPPSFVVREQTMISLYPRWGGDHESMGALATESQTLVKENPCMQWLLGFMDLDKGQTLNLHEKYEESIAVLTTAIRKGGNYHLFYSERGISYLHTGKGEQALEDFDRANELDPQDPELLILRAAAYVKLKKPKEALADLEVIRNFESPYDLWNQYHDWAIDALK